MSAVPVIDATQLARRFGRRWAFARVDLQVPQGERLLVLGANGSGKTTLLRTLATALVPSHGQLKLFGQDMPKQAGRVRARVGLLSHHTGLYEDVSARDNLGLMAHLMDKTGVALGPLLDRVGLEDRPDPIRTYSAGMRKRLSLALLLLKGPELVLLDEPFAALDPSGMDDVAGLVRELPGTVLIASHQVQRAATLCDRAVLLDGGVQRWLGPAHQAWSAWQAVHQPLDGRP